MNESPAIEEVAANRLPPNGTRILVVEDEEDIREAIVLLLVRQGYDVHVAANGAEAMSAIYDREPHLVLLDVAMPEMDGWEVLERIRAHSELPVMLLTAKGTDADKVRGLRGGADDYLVKPFSTRELVARVESVLRRAWRAPEPPAGGPRPSVHLNGRLVINMSTRRVTLDGEEVTLTPIEWRLVSVLLTNAGTLLTHNELLEAAWNEASSAAASRVKFSILRLRRKIGDDADSDESLIETVRGLGYRWREKPL